MALVCSKAFTINVQQMPLTIQIPSTHFEFEAPTVTGNWPATKTVKVNLPVCNDSGVQARYGAHVSMPWSTFACSGSNVTSSAGVSVSFPNGCVISAGGSTGSGTVNQDCNFVVILPAHTNVVLEITMILTVVYTITNNNPAGHCIANPSSADGSATITLFPQ